MTNDKEEMQKDYSKFNDHDLLIYLSASMDHAIGDIKNLSKLISESVSVLESKKVDRDNFEQMKDEFNATLARMEHTFNVIKEDHKKRLRRAEKWGFMGMGALAIVQMIIATQ